MHEITLSEVLDVLVLGHVISARWVSVEQHSFEYVLGGHRTAHLTEVLQHHRNLILIDIVLPRQRELLLLLVLLLLLQREVCRRGLHRVSGTSRGCGRPHLQTIGVKLSGYRSRSCCSACQIYHRPERTGIGRLLPKCDSGLVGCGSSSHRSELHTTCRGCVCTACKRSLRPEGVCISCGIES